MTDPIEIPERYTSYHHPEKIFSTLKWVQKRVKEGVCASFEYDGILYNLDQLSKDSPNWDGTISLDVAGPMFRYVMPWGGAGDPFNSKPPTPLATFRGDEFDEFIATYEIEGRTLEWILEHQREWKYTMDAAHLESILNKQCFSFAFVYRMTPCYIGEWDIAPNGIDREYYITLSFGEQYDIASYAPVTSGAEHWTEAFLRITNNSKASITLGPYATMGELLDRIRFGEKTLREIFNTEYDDGEVLCGCFGV